MTGGQTRAIDTIRQYERDGGKVPAKLKSELTWGAILDLYDLLEKLAQVVADVLPPKKRSRGWFVDRVLPTLITGVLTGGVLWAAFTLLPAVIAHIGAP